MMFGLCMRVSGKASILNLLAKNILGHDTQILLFPSALYCIKPPVSSGVWIVSGRVWTESEGVWV